VGSAKPQGTHTALLVQKLVQSLTPRASECMRSWAVSRTVSLAGCHRVVFGYGVTSKAPVLPSPSTKKPRTAFVA
jgi:hypothetical protein